MQPDRIPLFPLNVVLFPGEQLPLHIFEPRYRRMVADCLESEAPFGMVLALPDGIVRVGCTAQILQITKRYEDGRLDLATAGRRAFRVVKLFADKPLLEGVVDYLDDEDAAVDARKQKELIELYEACHTLVFTGVPKSFPETAEQQLLSYAVAAALPLDLLRKQQILELRSEAERQDRLLRYLGEWALHLQKMKTQRQRGAASSQGLN
jgi:Lon protease-like protein